MYGRSNFDKGLHILTTTLIKKRHIIIRTAILYNEINSGQIMKKHYACMYIYMCVYMCIYIYVCMCVYVCICVCVSIADALDQLVRAAMRYVDVPEFESFQCHI